jgi:Tol biopolymer transport system component
VLRTSLPRRLSAVAVLALGAALAAAPADAQFFGRFGKNKIQYREFDWQIYNAPHFDVYYYKAEEALLEKVVSYAESAYDRLSREFDHQIQDPIPLIFYATHSAFEQNNIIQNFIPEGIGAFATPVRSRMVMPVDLPDGELFELMMHELTHIFQYSIIFEGSFGRVAGGAPQWVMEGMASYMAKDEGTTEKMFLRDAVVNDAVPSILQRGVGGYMAYRFGHAAFDFMEERWGKEGFRDFVYEFRNTLGGRPERAVERALRIDAEDFDLDFRRWLRRKYLPQLVETGEPSDFGRPFRDEEGDFSTVISPTASPSGDLVAAFAVTGGDLDIILFDALRRRPIRNLTKGYTDEYQYLIAQHVIAQGRMGRDLAFSPDGNRLAFFAKREAGRSLVLFDLLAKKIERKIDMQVEQQHAPAWSPDGRRVAFSANKDGRFDIFVYDLESNTISNLTEDDLYDGAPVFAPDGKTLVYSAKVGKDYAQLFELDLANPKQRRRITHGEWSDKDAVFSSDGNRLYFTSDRTGIDNIWGLDRTTGNLYQFTNAVTGCLMPTVLESIDGPDRLVYTGFWRGQFDLYLADVERPIVEHPSPRPTSETPTEVAAEEAAQDPAEAPLERFEPDIAVTIDETAKHELGRTKLFLEDGGGSVGVSGDNYVIGQVYMSFSDYLGDHRLFVLLNSVDTFSDFNFLYVDQSDRLNWQVQVFDQREFFILEESATGQTLERSRSILRETGALASIRYPFNFYHRVEAGLGYVWRAYDFPQCQFDPLGRPFDCSFLELSQSYPLLSTSLVGDTAVYTQNGPISGMRYRLRGFYGYDTDEGGALTQNTDLDFRYYIPTTERSGFALRAFAGYADGSFPSLYGLGGLDTLRGFGYRTIIGDRAFFTNLEFRFPLIDYIASPILPIRGVRGRVFLDVGGAWNDYLGQEFDFWDSEESRLDDAVSSYGWGFTIQFLGLDLNWDFAQVWDFKDSLGEGFETDFWIGTRF